jgi:dolichol-phosphate mannosyltransferase
VQAAQLGLRIKEIGVPRVYLDPRRAFGGMLNDADERLAYYRRVIDDAMQQVQSRTNSCCDAALHCGL